MVPLVKDYTPWLERMGREWTLKHSSHYPIHFNAAKEALSCLISYQQNLAKQIREAEEQVRKHKVKLFRYSYSFLSCICYSSLC